MALKPADLQAIRRALEVLQRQETATASTTVAALWAQYEAWGLRERKGWRAAQAVHWKRLEPSWGLLDVAGINLTQVDAYRTLRTRDGCTPATRNRELSSLRACFAWGVKRSLVTFNPIAGMEQERENNQRTEFLDEAAFARLCAAAPNPMARALFVVAMDTGMRRGELVELRRASLDLEGRMIRMGDGECKNGEGRIVPLTERAVDAFRELPTWSTYVFSASGTAIGKSTINDWFRAARDKAGISRSITFHGLRHSCASLMRRRGVPWPLIKAALGWRTDVAARRYQSFNADDWTSLRERMNEGISTETRKPPLRAVENQSEKPVSDSMDARIRKHHVKSP